MQMREQLIKDLVALFLWRVLCVKVPLKCQEQPTNDTASCHGRSLLGNVLYQKMICCHFSCLVWLGYLLIVLWVVVCYVWMSSFMWSAVFPVIESKMLFFYSCTKYFWILKPCVCYWGGWVTYVKWSYLHLHIWHRKLMFCLWCCVLKFCN
jgi:hypothetical protein